MTHSENTVRDATWRIIGECPPWCAVDHKDWRWSHESEYAPIFDGRRLVSAYACGSAEPGAEDIAVAAHFQDVQSQASLRFSPREAYDFAVALEILAGMTPGQLEQLAAQVRTAAAAISGQTS